MPDRAETRRRIPAPVSDSLDRLGQRLRKARVEAGLSQAQLGAPHFTRAYISALELGKIRPAMQSLEFLATKLGRSVAHFMDDEEKERARRERELALARASQLIAQGSGQEAIEEIEAIPVDGIPLPDRLVVKRTLGRAYLEAGHAGRAAAVLGEVLRGYEALGDEEQAARARAQLGGALIALMSYSEAEEHLQSALKSVARGVIRDPLFRVHVLHNLGLTFYNRGDYLAALEHFERAAEEGSDVADQKWLASLFAAMGMAKRQVGDYEAAIRCLHKSEALFEALHNRSRVAEIRFQTARALLALGNKTRAREVLDEALDAAARSGAKALAVRVEAFIAWSDAQEGQHDEARVRLERLRSQAELIDDPELQFMVSFALAKTLGESRPDQAVKVLRDLADVLEKGGATSALADVYDELSRTLGRQGLADEALTYAQRAYATSMRSKGGV